MIEMIESSSFFSITLTLLAFAFSSACQKKWKIALLNPILISALLVILVLKVLGVSNETYQAGCKLLSFLLTPATICLAISFYEQFQKLKGHLFAIVAGVLAGTLCSFCSIYLLCRYFGLNQAMTLALLPKSVTNAIGVALSEEIGGIPAVTTAAIVITGILGNVAGPALCKLFRLKSELARGVALGTSAHVIGTARASEMSRLTGAVSSLSLTIAGIFTTVLLSFASQFI